MGLIGPIEGKSRRSILGKKNKGVSRSRASFKETGFEPFIRVTKEVKQWSPSTAVERKKTSSDLGTRFRFKKEEELVKGRFDHKKIADNLKASYKRPTIRMKLGWGDIQKRQHLTSKMGKRNPKTNISKNGFIEVGEMGRGVRSSRGANRFLIITGEKF